MVEQRPDETVGYGFDPRRGLQKKLGRRADDAHSPHFSFSLLPAPHESMARAALGRREAPPISACPPSARVAVTRTGQRRMTPPRLDRARPTSSAQVRPRRLRSGLPPRLGGRSRRVRGAQLPGQRAG